MYTEEEIVESTEYISIIVHIEKFGGFICYREKEYDKK